MLFLENLWTYLVTLIEYNRSIHVLSWFEALCQLTTTAICMVYMTTMLD
jgi:hypothetical protein